MGGIVAGADANGANGDTPGGRVDSSCPDGSERVAPVVGHRGPAEPDHAPYGWTHALTMPLALFQTAPVHGRFDEALDIATLLTAGFRHAHGVTALAAPAAAPAQPGAPSDEQTISAASIGHDAHLVKYVLACRHAARLDPDHDGLYRQAAAYLVEWWEAHPAADDPRART